MHEMPYKVPTHFNDRRIKYRVPYTMPGELIVAAAQIGLDFPEATFLHTIELPFEIWNVKLAAAQLVNNIPVAEPAPGINQFWRIRVQDVSRNQLMTKNAQLAATLIDDDWGGWYWRVPYTVERAEGFQVTIDNTLAANALRAAVTFRGYLLVLNPPSETR